MKSRRVLYAVMAAALAVLLAGGGLSAADAPANMTLMMENEYLQFYMDHSTAEFGVKNLETGDWWFSNPIDLEKRESIAKSTALQRLKAQLAIEYSFNAFVRSLDSYNDSIMYGQYRITAANGQVRVDYTIGKEYNDEVVIPLLIDQERFETKLLGKLSSDRDQNTLLDAYDLIYLVEVPEDERETPVQISMLDTNKLFANGQYELYTPEIADYKARLKDEPSLQARIDGIRLQLIVRLVDFIVANRVDYQSRSDVSAEDILQLLDNPTYMYKGLSGFRQRNVLTLINSVGYSIAEASFDREANNLDEIRPNLEVFQIPVIYRLDGPELVVTIPCDEIVHHESYRLTSISLLRFFGAADSTQSGYIFVPDGSGALINLNNGKTQMNAWASSIYGSDWALSAVTAVNTENVYLPVFGIKHEDKAMMAIIEEGDALGLIKADVSGRGNSFNTVHSEYRVRPVGSVTLDTGTAHGSKSRPMFQSRLYNGRITVRYAFLGADQASWVGMAAHYRDYLISKYGLERLSGEGTPFYLELIGAIHREQPVFGIPRIVQVPLTTFAEAEQLAVGLARDGVHNLHLIYSGWLQGGLHHYYPIKPKPEPVLGSETDLKELKATLDRHGIALSMAVNFAEVWRESSFDSFSPTNDASRAINRRVARVYQVNPATGDRIAETAAYLVSPASYGTLIHSFAREFARYGIQGLAPLEFGRELSSDFRDDPDQLVDRQQARRIVEEQLHYLKDLDYQIVVEGGNAYAVPYADTILQVPFESSNYNIVDETVPFYQMVVHGLVNYTGGAINVNAADSRVSFLKAIEYGASLYYKWMKNDFGAVKGTLFNTLNSIQYDDWYDHAVRCYQEAKEVLDLVYGRLMLDHRRLGEGVYATLYEGGIEVVVNYNDYPVQVGGLVIEALDFAWNGGEGYEAAPEH